MGGEGGGLEIFLKKAKSRGINGCKMNAWIMRVNWLNYFIQTHSDLEKINFLGQNLGNLRVKFSKNCKRGPPSISCQRVKGEATQKRLNLDIHI